LILQNNSCGRENIIKDKLFGGISMYVFSESNSILKIDRERLDLIIENETKEEYGRSMANIKAIVGESLLYLQIESEINSLITITAEKMYLFGLKNGVNLLNEINKLL
jgi:hypothetical protein